MAGDPRAGGFEREAGAGNRFEAFNGCRGVQFDELARQAQPFSMPTMALTKIAPSAVGIITFQPMFINWS